ncbi:MAG: 30S ribosomal protein S8e [Candidatus Bathyarchaeota archaeon]
MPLWHHDLKKKKITGGKKRPYRSKRAFEAGGFASETSLGASFRTVKKVHGGALKTKLLSEKYANVTDPSANITKKAEIVRVLNNPVNAEYNRRKIMTKGTLIETSLGEAIITSRPGQIGAISAILTKKGAISAILTKKRG